MRYVVVIDPCENWNKNWRLRKSQSNRYIVKSFPGNEINVGVINLKYLRNKKRISMQTKQNLVKKQNWKGGWRLNNKGAYMSRKGIWIFCTCNRIPLEESYNTQFKFFSKGPTVAAQWKMDYMFKKVKGMKQWRGHCRVVILRDIWLGKCWRRRGLRGPEMYFAVRDSM